MRRESRNSLNPNSTLPLRMRKRAKRLINDPHTIAYYTLLQFIKKTHKKIQIAIYSHSSLPSLRIILIDTRFFSTFRQSSEGLLFVQILQYSCDCCYHNYRQMDLKKVALIGAGAATLFVAGLFIKNVIDEKKMQALKKEDLLRLLRLIRKEKYLLYKQIANFAVSIAQQMRGNINPQAIEQFLNGPECPFKYSEENQKAVNKVCEDNNTSVDAYYFSLEQLAKEPEIAQLIEQQALDYRTSVAGRLPTFDVKVPSSLTKEKYYQLQNQLTKATYMHQVRLFKMLQTHSQIQIQQNPALLKDIGSPQVANEQMLREQGLGSEFEPASAIFDAAGLQFRAQRDFQTKVQAIEGGYQKILMKYAQRLQAKSITDAELNQMEEEIIYFEPI